MNLFKKISSYRTGSTAPTQQPHIAYCDNYIEQINLMTVYVMISFVAQFRML